MSSRISVRRSTVALWLVFFVNGAVLASWAPRIPEVKSGLSLSDGQVGWTLLGVAAGSIPALIGTARVLSWVSVRQVCAITAFTFPLALPLIALAPNGWALAAALTVLGFASGSLDVAMNSAAIECQNRTDTTILSRLHGGYSLGVLIGAGFGAVATVFDVSVLAHFCRARVPDTDHRGRTSRSRWSRGGNCAGECRRLRRFPGWPAAGRTVGRKNRSLKGVRLDRVRVLSGAGQSVASAPG